MLFMNLLFYNSTIDKLPLKSKILAPNGSILLSINSWVTLFDSKVQFLIDKYEFSPVWIIKNPN